MDDCLMQAIELVKAQASVRVMQEDEVTAMISSLAAKLRNMEAGSDADIENDSETLAPSKSIKEKTVTCLECGKSFKLITRKHLAQHGLDADAYREKWGIKRGAPLVCKSLQRVRRKKMKDMKLWEKRRQNGETNE